MESLYHYCSTEKCLSILKYQSIRLSDIQKSNDYLELNLLYPTIFDVIRDMYYQDPFPFVFEDCSGGAAIQKLLSLSKAYWTGRFSSGDFSNFVLCFSERGNLLSQWRGYADNGQGCCLEFSRESLQSYCASTNGVIRMEKVRYMSEQELRNHVCMCAALVLQILSEMRGKLSVNAEIAGDDRRLDELTRFNFDTILENMFIESLCCKSVGFQEEQEWRIFFSMCPFREPDWYYGDVESKTFDAPELFVKTVKFLNERIDFRATQDDLIPFCLINFDEFASYPLKSVWLGPKNKIRDTDFRMFLRKNNNPAIKIFHSGITYR